MNIADHDGTILLKVKLNQATTVRAVIYGLVECAPPSTVYLVVLWRPHSLHSFNNGVLLHAVGEHFLRVVNFHKALTLVFEDHDEVFVAE